MEVSPPVASFEEDPEIRPDKSSNTLEPPSVQAPGKKATCEKTGADKILTEKKPYKMRQLLKDMQEMEAMMEDMKKKIRQYKN
jgi:cysteine synthase